MFTPLILLVVNIYTLDASAQLAIFRCTSWSYKAATTAVGSLRSRYRAPAMHLFTCLSNNFLRLLLIFPPSPHIRAHFVVPTPLNFVALPDKTAHLWVMPLHEADIWIYVYRKTILQMECCLAEGICKRKSLIIRLVYEFRLQCLTICG
jgi:hypothetical protein